MRWFMVPGVILFAFVMAASSPTIVKLIAPLSVGAVMVILCVIDVAVAIPIAIKLGKIKEQILKINGNKPQ